MKAERIQAKPMTSISEIKEPLWEVIDLVKRYPGVVANDHVSLKLFEGSIHGLLGENGCGKSTLIKMLSGVQPPDAGRIRCRGEDVQLHSPTDARAKGIATVFQEFSIVPSLTVAENIFLGRLPTGKFGGVDWAAMNREAKAVLAEMEVDLDPEDITGDLSVAEQQLVEIAKALASDASMIILDEPTAALGLSEIDHLHKLLRRMRENGCAILYVSHRLDEVERIVDEVTILRGGQVVRASGETEISVDNIVAAMIGEDVGEHYPKTNNSREEIVLEARGLTTAKGVSDASFSVQAGEVLGLGGVLGSGRTEIALGLFGVDPLLAGELKIHGKPVKIKSPMDAIRAGMALVSENRKFDGLFPNFAAGGNITAAGLSSITRAGFLHLATEDKVTAEYIRKLEISPQADSKTINLLSGGNQQKVILARWLFCNADILIFDEPTQGIDVGAKLAVYRLINELTAQGKSIILISSDHDELLAMSDRIATVQHGTVIGITKASELSHVDLVKASSDEATHKLQESAA
ncbi:MAG: sugar ABC transporter ATP-binding protein [Roseibium sp.]|uniref:sugar ABC transporter ATP-binding protein n=1 Tax=Roseibium sp. TaxID=1936156 RepID=UPI00262E6A48|nr:sugar ABC transporter ATP-binding protein [Roseibium sp.]MCV0426651.1 sugar ABC transporter ATP-binding protein [Roseibium sp.]